MEVRFASRRMQRSCSSDREMGRQWDKSLARRLKQRLLELRAADTLHDIDRVPPARCHELTGNRQGQLSVDVTRNYRLVFEPDHDPLPTKADGGLDWTRVTEIVVLEVCDTHE